MKNRKLSALLCGILILFCAVANAQTAQTPNPTPAPDTGALPESYYNSLKNQTGSTVVQSAAQATPITTNTDTATPTDEPNVATNTATPTENTTVESTVPANEPPLAIESQPTKAVDSSLFNATYVLTELGNLRYELQQMRDKYDGPKVGGENAGYDGSFYMKSADDKFRLNMNFRFQAHYIVNIAEDVQDGHTFAFRRALMMLSGNAWNDKISYVAVLSLINSPALVYFDMGYNFSEAFSIHFDNDPTLLSYEIGESSGKFTFIEPSLFAERYGFDGAMGIFATGAYKWFSYYVGVKNGFDNIYAPNINNEMVYGARFDFALLNTLSPGMGDLANSQKPGLGLGIGAVYGNEEDTTQARLMAVTSDLRFKYKGLSLGVAGLLRQIDPDQFTIAQYDAAAMAYATYYIIPEKLEIGLRYAHLFDDLNDAGVNMRMGAGNRTRLGGPTGVPSLSGGDVGGDSDNEWETSVAMSYYFQKFRAKIQGQYLMVVDGVAGPDDLVNHIGIAQVHLEF